MPLNNTVIISAAGSRKTTYIVEEALLNPDQRILILTYTIDNLNQIRSYFIEKAGMVPANVRIHSWYSFLLQQCVRPYQNFVYEKQRVETIAFVQGTSAQYAKKTDIERYYFTGSNRIYTDKISEFACTCDDKSYGLVIKRLEKIFDHVFIDEIQDLAGYDFEFLELLFKSSITVTAVGDSRQATYVTNHSPKNKQFKGQNIINLFRLWRQQGLCKIEERNECYRCNQAICDFADALYPEMQKTKSKQTLITNHDGLFIVRRKDLQQYIEKYQPKVLRYKISEATSGLNALNFGLSKGQTFERVIIFPTTGITEYLRSGNSQKLGDKPKFYVAITRAKYSVAFLHDKEYFDDTLNIFQA